MWTYQADHGNIGLMRKLSDDHKVSVRSLSEVATAFGVLAARLRNDKALSFHEDGKDKKANQSSLVNALYLWFHARPEEEQRVILLEGTARLRALLAAGEGGVPLDAPAPSSADVVRPTPGMPMSLEGGGGKGKAKGRKNG